MSNCESEEDLGDSPGRDSFSTPYLLCRKTSSSTITSVDFAISDADEEDQLSTTTDVNDFSTKDYDKKLDVTCTPPEGSSRISTVFTLGPKVNTNTTSGKSIDPVGISNQGDSENYIILSAEQDLDIKDMSGTKCSPQVDATATSLSNLHLDSFAPDSSCDAFESSMSDACESASYVGCENYCYCGIEERGEDDSKVLAPNDIVSDINDGGNDNLLSGHCHPDLEHFSAQLLVDVTSRTGVQPTIDPAVAGSVQGEEYLIAPSVESESDGKIETQIQYQDVAMQGYQKKRNTQSETNIYYSGVDCNNDPYFASLMQVEEYLVGLVGDTDNSVGGCIQDQEVIMQEYQLGKETAMHETLSRMTISESGKSAREFERAAEFIPTSKNVALSNACSGDRDQIESDGWEVLSD